MDHKDSVVENIADVEELDLLTAEDLSENGAAAAAGWCLGSAGTFGCPSTASSYGCLT